MTNRWTMTYALGTMIVLSAGMMLHAQTGTIQGCSWNDLNGNGVWDDGEPGMQNWKVYVDENENGLWDEGEPYDMTDAYGAYELSGLDWGVHRVAQVEQEDWIQMFPGWCDEEKAAQRKPAVKAATDTLVWSGWKPMAQEKAGAYETTVTCRMKGKPKVEGRKDQLTVTVPGEETWQVWPDPLVPVRITKLLLPQDADVADVELDLGPGVVVATGVKGLFTPPQPQTTANRKINVPASKLQNVRGESFPLGSMVQHNTVHLRGYSVAILRVFPVKYDAKKQTVTYYPQIRVTVHAQARKGGGTVRVRDRPADAEAVLRFADNGTYAAEYKVAGRPKSGTLPTNLGNGPFEYVIVTSEALEDTFQDLIDHKQSRGLTARIVTTEYIYANYSGIESGDNADKVRDFIRDAYNNWDTEWVLLGGDTDQVPLRICCVHIYTPDIDIPTDVYFACLDGTWDGDDDAIWGERFDGDGGGDIDLTPDVHVARAPASTPVEASRFVRKTIQYELTGPWYPKKAVWLGEKLNDYTWGSGFKEPVADDCVPPSWNITKRYDHENVWALEELIGDLNGGCHIVNHFGHSDYHMNAKLYRNHIDALHNTYPYFIYSCGCNSGAFDAEDGDCMAEHHVVYRDSGAFGAVMNSRYGFYSTGITYSAKYDYNFWDAVFNEGITELGAAQTDSKMECLPFVGISYYRWLHFCITLFGDPETSFHVDQAEPGVYTVELLSGDGVANSINFGNQHELGNVDADTSSVNVAESTITAFGSTAVTVHLLDEYGNALPWRKADIAFSVSGTGDTIVSGLTEIERGVYEATFAGSSPGEKVISVQVMEGGQPVTLTNTATVTIIGPEVRIANLRFSGTLLYFDLVLDDANDISATLRGVGGYFRVHGADAQHARPYCYPLSNLTGSQIAAVTAPTPYAWSGFSDLSYCESESFCYYTSSEQEYVPLESLTPGDAVATLCCQWDETPLTELSIAFDTFQGAPWFYLPSFAQFKMDVLNENTNLVPELGVSAEVDWSWVYENTEVTTGFGHKSILTITVDDDPLDNSAYDATVEVDPESAGDVTVNATEDPLVWEIIGGDRNGATSPVGNVNLVITVTGAEFGGLGGTSAQVAVRRLGDIDGSGWVDQMDNWYFNRRYYGMSTPYPDRHYDLDADNDVDIGDRTILTNMLNGVPIP
ncbi:MAG: hypothetical protein JW955_09535 [Sedimentisphaerales bacterium]|nr:hypothetical protein [Sedimentisphaerales bacterium]